MRSGAPGGSGGADGRRRSARRSRSSETQETAKARRAPKLQQSMPVALTDGGSRSGAASIRAPSPTRVFRESLRSFALLRFRSRTSAAPDAPAGPASHASARLRAPVQRRDVLARLSSSSAIERALHPPEALQLLGENCTHISLIFSMPTHATPVMVRRPRCTSAAPRTRTARCGAADPDRCHRTGSADAGCRRPAWKTLGNGGRTSSPSRR